MKVSVELLTFPLSPKYEKASNSPTALFNALTVEAPRAGMRVTRTKSYQGASDWLMLYGPGGLNRVNPMTKQWEKGGHVVCWDAAYWQRARKLRVSIDGAHPQQWVMRRDWGPERFAKDGIKVRNEWNPDGPVVIASIGTKARAQYGNEIVETWERAFVEECRQKWPRVQILYRPKPNHPATPPEGTIVLVGNKPIDDVLRGTRLLATWHSNVAVDAIRLGIPVVCQDGAAAAVAPLAIPERSEPLADDLRRRFLANLAWFQWAPHEAKACWRFLRTLLV